MQGVPIVGEKEKGSTCDKATKGIARKETSVPYEGRSAGKKVEKDRERKYSICYYAASEFSVEDNI